MYFYCIFNKEMLCKNSQVFKTLGSIPNLCSFLSEYHFEMISRGETMKCGSEQWTE